MKRPNTHNKRKRERQLGALERAESDVQKYANSSNTSSVRKHDSAKRAVEVLRKKLNLKGDVNANHQEI